VEGRVCRAAGSVTNGQGRPGGFDPGAVSRETPSAGGQAGRRAGGQAGRRAGGQVRTVQPMRGQARCAPVGVGSVRLSQAQSGSVRLSQVGQARAGSGRLAQARAGSGRLGQARAGSGRLGQARAGSGRLGHARARSGTLGHARARSGALRGTPGHGGTFDRVYPGGTDGSVGRGGGLGLRAPMSVSAARTGPREAWECDVGRRSQLMGSSGWRLVRLGVLVAKAAAGRPQVFHVKPDLAGMGRHAGAAPVRLRRREASDMATRRVVSRETTGRLN
jgi:hypothetical protein